MYGGGPGWEEEEREGGGPHLPHQAPRGVRGQRNHSLSVKGRPGQQSGVGRLCREVADSVQSWVKAPPTGPGKAGGPS